MDEKVLSSAIVKFSIRLLDELDKKRSVVSSPLSVEILLALLALGATGKTHTELLAELGYPDADTIRLTFAQLTERLKNIKGVTLDVANKIYMNAGVDLQPHMQEDAINVFNTGFEIMDFKDVDAVAKHVNDWVEHNTHKKIENIVKPNEIHDSQEMILFNAIYFKGNWAHPFDKGQTSEEQFYVDEYTTIMVPMMRQIQNFRYGNCHELEAQFLVLPYIGDESKMAIILPHSDEPDAVNKIVKKIASGYELMDRINGISSRKVRVQIPTFKIETEIKLTDVLKKLGINSMFNTGFDKLVKSQRPVHVSDAIQKAVIEVNEEGTEAAAVTKKMIQTRCGPQHFIADHPFLYILLGPHDIPLFVGIYRGDENAPRAERRMRIDDDAIEIFSL